MKTLKEFNVKNKRVLLRCDFNVPLDEKGEISDDFRIRQSIPTIEYLINKKAKPILISHLGSSSKAKRLSLKPIAIKLEKLLNRKVKFLDDCVGEKIEKEIKKMKIGEPALLENLRFYKEEEKNDKSFAKKLSRLGDIYVNDAFGACHRAHGSIVGLPKYLPSAAGLLLQKEVNILSKVLENPWRPLVAIIGGVKIASKIKVISRFLRVADHLLLGGEIANTILVVKGICVGRPLPEKEVIKEVNKFELTNPKFHLPLDVVVSPDKTGKIYVRVSAPAKARKDELILDIGPETIGLFARIIREAKMLVWSGPLGLFEEKPFEKGTKEIAQVIVRNYKAFKIAGGGDTLFALNKFGVRDRFDHVSTGGGAMLDFLSGKKLPGLEALK